MASDDWIRDEIVRLIRSEVDSEPYNWDRENGVWHDGAEEAADKIIALFNFPTTRAMHDVALTMGDNASNNAGTRDTLLHLAAMAINEVERLDKIFDNNHT